MRRIGAALLAALTLVVACGGSPRVATATPSRAGPERPTATEFASAAPTATPAPVPTPRPLPHVFLIVMENTGLTRALRSGAIASIASRYAVATNYHAVARPSLPNYLAMTSGQTWGIADDGYHVLPATGLGTQLTVAGISWRAYMEGMTGAGCMRSPYPYALKHDPFAYYGGACPENVVPLEALEADLARDTPTFVWITPGLCHDGHDCSLDVAGGWLEGVVARVIASPAWDDRATLFIVWDEGDGGDRNLVPLIVAAKRTLPRELTAAYDHYSLLATIEDRLGLPRLGAAADAHAIAEVLAGD